jgi:hypothetical protein
MREVGAGAAPAGVLDELDMLAAELELLSPGAGVRLDPLDVASPLGPPMGVELMPLSVDVPEVAASVSALCPQAESARTAANKQSVVADLQVLVVVVIAFLPSFS